MGLSSLLGVSSKTVDSSLDALFSTSVGPAKLDKTPMTKPKKHEASTSTDSDSDDNSDNSDDEDSDEVVIGSDDEVEESEEKVRETAKERKRKRKQADEDLETKYLQKLAADEEEETEKPQKRIKSANVETNIDVISAEASSDASEDLIHESLKKKDSTTAAVPIDEVEKATRTVFLANVAAQVSTNKTQKKALLSHLSTIIDPKATPAESIESIRFRSLAFATAAMPKRAAFITKATQEATTRSCNAYVVYSSAALARKACAELNGTKVLDRHLRVDSVAHPAATDGRRCVFVGNLGFVDDESVFSTDAEGNTERKKRNKVPSDIEEGLWRVFGEHAGKVESVRVVRDPKTRVGKGFAYVQFYDANHVEKALLLNEKKFPPMLPRKLRVTRAKDPRKTNNALVRSRNKTASTEKAKTAPKSTPLKHVPKVTAEEQSMAGRANKLLGRAGARRQVHAENSGRNGERPTKASGSGVNAGRRPPVIQTSEREVLEGRRASAYDGKPNDIKFSKKGNGGVRKKKPTGRRAQRTSEWKKKTGGK